MAARSHGLRGRFTSPFTTNQPGDDTFVRDLNGHPFSENCNAGYGNHDEAPSSRPSRADGVLYVNLYAAGNDDIIVGGASQTGDCLGRRLARNHAPDVANREIAGVPGAVLLGEVHKNFPHYWPTICTTLKVVVDHQPPSDPVDPIQVCAGLTSP